MVPHLKLSVWSRFEHAFILYKPKGKVSTYDNDFCGFTYPSSKRYMGLHFRFNLDLIICCLVLQKKKPSSNSFEPVPIVEAEEKERQALMAQRDFLVRSFRVVDQVDIISGFQTNEIPIFKLVIHGYIFKFVYKVRFFCKIMVPVLYHDSKNSWNFQVN